jgi:hypothetical protein
MKDDAKTQLKKIISDYDAKLAENERVEKARREAQAAFPARFVSLKTEIIQPAIKEIVDMLNEGGHVASVREQEDSSTAEGGVKSAAISLRVVPRPFTAKASELNAIAIEVTFSANRAARKVAVSSTNTMINHGGTVGKRGEYELEDVTADVVTTHVLQTLTEAFGGPR